MNTEIAVFKSCEFYDLIVNFAYSKTDYISELLISEYKNYVLSKKRKNKKTLKKYDYIMHEYISNKFFYKYVQEDYSSSLTFEVDLRAYLFKIYNKFCDEFIRVTKVSRWI